MKRIEKETPNTKDAHTENTGPLTKNYSDNDAFPNGGTNRGDSDTKDTHSIICDSRPKGGTTHGPVESSRPCEKSGHSAE